jgi:hypothetical protein
MECIWVPRVAPKGLRRRRVEMKLTNPSEGSWRRSFGGRFPVSRAVSLRMTPEAVGFGGCPLAYRCPRVDRFVDAMLVVTGHISPCGRGEARP